MDNTESLVCKDCKASFVCSLKWRQTYGFWCKDCKREYTRKNLVKFRAAYPTKVKAYKAEYDRTHHAQKTEWHRKYRLRRRAFVADIKMGMPCTDCGETYPPYIMEFDHVKPGKLGCVGSMAAHSRKRILAEIEKCELVCANCHRERTHQRRVQKRNVGHSVQPARIAVGSIQQPG